MCLHIVLIQIQRQSCFIVKLTKVHLKFNLSVLFKISYEEGMIRVFQFEASVLVPTHADDKMEQFNEIRLNVSSAVSR